ncbi:thiazole synthase [Coxiella burnetii]|uniref:Thiazole synthase n=2 Tax=Coxiella burnetii TaxID=777 RepID=THIG_COXBU|nr:thiazole synthase [Coxiella burnetii]NP_819375.1 thiazole biosynthesis protein [Coxiella burnetii RSA 493]A9NB65.1 RecName: Full=Thiazole synthase [Coxiella burnetii RSA 331]Q83EI7.1 RecName: Full=Thiazole synthase [Coxiella burnetii RSA 493]AAO89889.1 thiazole biosynthesis protein [Coxiella burnetii RSA 493]ABX78015.1 thiazole biosynthesis protein ThiG [Coxiella burnetii RSA 331]AML49681.1 thiazole synthase [Coxiella burnetii]ARI65227.1 thiazole synthase [Coxiella burnetii]ARK26715.1 th
MWAIGGVQLNSRLLLGTAQYPSPQLMSDAVKAAGVEIITVSLRRQLSPQKENYFWDLLRSLPCHLLPNTAGCSSVKEAVNTARAARELFNTHWIKLEIIGDEYTLQPNPFELVNAATILVKEGFEVFPYCTEDLILCQRLVDAGCRVLMPWAAPIGSGRGLMNTYALQVLRERFPKNILIIDAGLGRPSHAAQVMEMGFDAVLLNSAVALAMDPVVMAAGFAKAVEGGRLGYEGGMIKARNVAKATTPLIGKPFLIEKP